MAGDHQSHLKTLRKLFHDNFLKYMSPLNFSKLGQRRVSWVGGKGWAHWLKFPDSDFQESQRCRKDSRTTEQLYSSGPTRAGTLSLLGSQIVPLWLDHLGTFPATLDQLTSASARSWPLTLAWVHSSSMEIQRQLQARRVFPQILALPNKAFPGHSTLK